MKRIITFILIIIMSFFMVSCGQNVTSGVKGEQGIQGEPGEKGEPGKSAYEIYKEAHPEYNKSESEWLDDLINGSLSNTKTHTVKFDTDGGSKIDDLTVKHNEKINIPINPTKEGYKFDSWFYGDNRWIFDIYTVTDDMVLKASWDPIILNVNVDMNGDKILEVHDSGYYNNEYYLENPKKEGHIFDHFEDKDGNTITSPFIVKNDIDIYSIFRDYAYVNFDTDGGNSINPLTVKINSNVEELPIPVKNDCQFDGWYLDNKKIEAPFKYETLYDMKLKAHWKLVSDSFNYEIMSDNNIKLTEYNGNDLAIILPNEIQNKKVTTLGSSIFQNNLLINSVTLGDNIEIIEDNAFNGCINLQELNLGKNTKIFGSKILSGCISLRNLTISDDIPLLSLFDFNENNIPNKLVNLTIIKNDNKEKNYNETIFKDINNTLFEVALKGTFNEYNFSFKDCRAIRTVNLEYLNLINLPDRLFYRSSLEYIIIPEGIIDLGKDTFYNSNLYVIVLPKSIKNCSETFYLNNSLKHVLYPLGDEDWFNVKKPDKPFEYVELNSKVEKFEYVQENDCSYIKTDTKSIYKLDWKDTSIVSLDMNKRFKGFKVIDFTEKSFVSCGELQNIIFSDGLIEIPTNAFLGSNKLTNIKLPDTVIKIRSYAFYSNINIQEIVIPKSVKYIGQSAFGGYDSLTIYAEALTKPEGWEKSYTSTNNTKIYWGNSWEYDQNGNPKLK